jgi:thiamine kinase-like enzyme
VIDSTTAAALDQLEVLRGRSREVTELSGGLTNLNLLVTLDDRQLVVRIVRSDSSLLDIDPKAEYANTVIAAAVGVGAPVVEHRPELGMTVLEFLPGRTLTDDDFADPGLRARAIDAVHRLHAGPRFVNDFDMFTRQQRYRQIVADHGFHLPSSYDDYAAAWEDVRRVLTATAGTTVPCNNDLLAANLIDDGERVWLIDYDYSGNNDPAFELGSTVSECDFDADLTAAWTAAYYGRDDISLLARVRLQALCSQYGWALWGFIQAGSSELDYDFEEWGLSRFEKAVRTFTSIGFRQLLDEVAAGG